MEVGRRSLFPTREITVRFRTSAKLIPDQDECDAFSKAVLHVPKTAGLIILPFALPTPAIFRQQLLVTVFEVFLHLDPRGADSSVQHRRYLLRNH
jgi:hypothetical protein